MNSNDKWKVDFLEFIISYQEILNWNDKYWFFTSDFHRILRLKCFKWTFTATLNKKTENRFFGANIFLLGKRVLNGNDK